mmetsp:Transcript_12685/g.23554  ORF Transcript_12685/g.23554 Transcript_12685/m.23554 type:complete len:345 (-) Transcript_12685:3593-4627(-)
MMPHQHTPRLCRDDACNSPQQGEKNCRVVIQHIEDFSRTTPAQFGRLEEMVQKNMLVVIRGGVRALRPEQLVQWLETLHSGKARGLNCQGALRGKARGLGHLREGEVLGVPGVRRLGNVPGALFTKTGLEWHSDGPGAFTALHCVKTPRHGGNTFFASSTELFNRLDPIAKVHALGTQVKYSSRFTSGKGQPSAVDYQQGLRMNARGTAVLYPAARRLVPYNGVAEETVLPLIHQNARGESFWSLDSRHMDSLYIFGRALSPKSSRRILDHWLCQGLEPFQKPSISPVTQTFGFRGAYEHKWEQHDLLLWHNDGFLHSPSPVHSYARCIGSREMLQCIYHVSID